MGVRHVGLALSKVISVSPRQSPRLRMKVITASSVQAQTNLGDQNDLQRV
jgi:hypothetical protein